MQEDIEAHAYPSPQHPPPIPTGQAWELVEHASVVWRPVYVLVGTLGVFVTTVVAVTGVTTVTIVKLGEAWT